VSSGVLYKIIIQSGTISLGNFLFNRRVVLTFFMMFREYVRMFLHPIGMSLAESFNLVSKHVDIMM